LFHLIFGGRPLLQRGQAPGTNNQKTDPLAVTRRFTPIAATSAMRLAVNSILCFVNDYPRVDYCRARKRVVALTFRLPPWLISNRFPMPPSVGIPALYLVLRSRFLLLISPPGLDCRSFTWLLAIIMEDSRTGLPLFQPLWHLLRVRPISL
jgi:hypothetical protein